MANPTAKVGSTQRKFEQTRTIKPVYQSTSTTFYDGEMIGERLDGYVTHFDDTASLRFVGLYIGGVPHKLDSTDLSFGTRMPVDCPMTITMPLNTGSAGVADIGKIAYAYDSGKVILSSAALTYGNPIGTVVAVHASPENPLTLSGAYVEILPFREPRHTRATRTMAATGAQDITKFDVNKTILVPNTAALTLNLPAVADCQAGDRITFIKTAAAAFAITLDGASSETIDGGATVATMDANHDTITIECDGTNWRIVAQKIA